MNRKAIVILAAGVFAAALFFGWMKPDTVDLDFAEEGSAVFEYGGTNSVHLLSDQEIRLIKNIFDGKELYRDAPSCGFTDKISVRFDHSQTFCFARDTCPVIYWKEKDRYFSVAEEEKMQLYDLLEAYGFFFPCP